MPILGRGFHKQPKPLHRRQIILLYIECASFLIHCCTVACCCVAYTMIHMIYTVHSSTVYTVGFCREYGKPNGFFFFIVFEVVFEAVFEAAFIWRQFSLLLQIKTLARKFIQNGGRIARLLQYSTHNTISMYHPYSAVPLRGKCHCRNLWILYCTGTGICINMMSSLF